ncbi:MAG: hypothetical protein CML17_12890, partial [Pusillimonas sp.]|nr:hypothetical protein [Pusillimonas sp.]
QLITTGDITDDVFLDRIGDIELGLVTSHHYSMAHDSPENKELIKAYQDVHGPDERVNFYMAATWDGMNMIYDIIRELDGNIDGDKAVELARNMKNSLFRSMTPVEAVSLAIAQREGNALRVFGTAALGRRTGEEARELLQAVGLGQYMNHITRELPYGLQCLLEVALALAGKPKVLLLDEPAAGVSAQAGDQLFRLIDSLPSDLAILLLEHDMRLVFRFAKRITVLVGGGVLVEGTPEEIAADQRVRDVYLGHKHAA